ncbi:hypothetical protein PYCC9005_000119 [Savitreella phatthalungensis]
MRPTTCRLAAKRAAAVATDSTTSAYIPGKQGYAPGFLPPRVHVTSRDKTRIPDPATTARNPATPHPPADTHKDAVRRWKAELTERRRGYMALHLQNRIDDRPRRAAASAERQRKGFELRELALHAPVSEAERLSTPAVDGRLADVWPLTGEDKDVRRERRAAGRRTREEVVRESRLAAFLEVHHRAARFATNAAELDRMLASSFQPILSFNAAPTYTLRELEQDRNGIRAREFNDALRDAQHGTAAGGQPGVAEVGHILRKNSNSDSPAS